MPRLRGQKHLRDDWAWSGAQHAAAAAALGDQVKALINVAREASSERGSCYELAAAWVAKAAAHHASEALALWAV